MLPAGFNESSEVSNFRLEIKLHTIAKYTCLIYI